MRVSVVIPVFNRARYLRDAVSSVLATGHSPLEVLIVDDGSTDNSGAVARKLSEEYPGYIRVLTHAVAGNHGPGAARNLGVREAAGDLVCFLDADDLMLPHRFCTAVQVLATHDKADGVYDSTGMLFEDAAAELQWRPRPTVWPTRTVDEPRDLLRTMLLEKMGTWHTAAILVRRGLFDRTGLFDERLRIGEDIDMWLRMAIVGRILPGQVSRPVVLYRRHAANSWSVNALEDCYRDIWIIRNAVGWAAQRCDMVADRPVATLVQAFDTHVLRYLQLARKLTTRRRLTALACRALAFRPALARQRAFLGNLAYAYLRR